MSCLIAQRPELSKAAAMLACYLCFTLPPIPGSTHPPHQNLHPEAAPCTKGWQGSIPHLHFSLIPALRSAIEREEKTIAAPERLMPNDHVLLAVLLASSKTMWPVNRKSQKNQIPSDACE